MQLMAEFNNSFGSLVRASVGPESEAGHDDLTLLGSFGPVGQAKEQPRQNHQSVAKLRGHINTKTAAQHASDRAALPQGDSVKQRDAPTPQKMLRDIGRDDLRGLKIKKAKKDKISSSEDSESPKPKKKKTKRNHQTRARPLAPRVIQTLCRQTVVVRKTRLTGRKLNWYMTSRTLSPRTCRTSRTSGTEVLKS